MKNFLKSKGFLVSALILSCIGILIACWYVSRDQTSDFQPAETSNVIQSQNWEEHRKPLKAIQKKQIALKPMLYLRIQMYMNPLMHIQSCPKYPKAKSLLISLRQKHKPNHLRPYQKEKRFWKMHQEHPVNPAPDVTAPEPETSSNNEPSAGDTNQDEPFTDPYSAG